MNVTLSNQHADVIRELYNLRERLTGLSRSEGLNLEMAIMMLEYLPEHVADVSIAESQLCFTERLLQTAERVATARRPSRLRWTIDDFDQLICSGGFELVDDVLEPRF